MPLRPIDLSSYFPFLLGTIGTRWTTTASRFYLDRFGVGIGEWRVLASIQALGSASSNEVVTLVAMDAGAVSRSVARLANDSLIAPVEGRFAGRRKPYRLTPKGRRLYGTLRRVALQREDTLLAALTPEERQTLIVLMRKVHSQIGSL